MDLVTVEKLQAMKKYRKNQFFLNLMQYCLSLLCLGLFLSSPLWLPKLCSSTRHFFLVSIPSMLAYLCCPSCLFVLGNAIVLFLVGESRLSGSTSAPVDVYEEYMARSKGLRGGSLGVGKEGADKGSVGTLDGLKEEIKEGEEEEEEKEKVVVVEEEEEEEEKEMVVVVEEEEEEEEEEEGFPADELNRRVEDFIARVNRERKLEARMLVCHG